MEYQQFFDEIKQKLPPGTVLQNPGGGTSTIKSYSETQIVYKRGSSNIYAEVRAFYDAYIEFNGKTVTSNDLKGYEPKIFDPKFNGHSCNCTMLFIVLEALGITTTVNGTGKRGHPFWITIASDTLLAA